ncbi:MAG: Fis family transcriptional regulator [Gammaproteobacteria bacterium]|nr:Fis family transcriptional regulator [Gammaproteobacteria bacterium]
MNASPRKAIETTRSDGESAPLCALVERSVEGYFNRLNGEKPSELYELVLSQVERPLLEVTLRATRGNISRAADYLGLNRATLRKKLQKYGLAG